MSIGTVGGNLNSNAYTILSGNGAPDSSVGSDGFFYIDVVATKIYGPKASGAWGGGTSLVGAPGSSGSDGREVEFRTSGGYIQWRYEGEASWTDLVTLASVTGPAGSPGAAGSTGATGAAGAAATISVGSVTTEAAARVADCEPGVTALPVALEKAQQGNIGDFAACWGLVAQYGATPAELIGELVATAEACHLPEAFVAALSPATL